MTKPTRSEVLHAMYMKDDDEDESEGPKLPEPIKSGALTLAPTEKSVRVTVEGERSVDVAPTTYVRQLEKTVNAQEREIRRLTNREKAMRAKLNEMAKEINEIWRELEKKVDFR